MAYEGRILTRSPYYIKASGTIIETAKLDIYIWDGDLTTDKPANPQYVIEKTPLQSGDNDIYFEISELIRDYYTYTYDPPATLPSSYNDVLWVAVDITIVDSTGLLPLVSNHYLAQDGYGYFSDGANPSLNYNDETILTHKFNPFNPLVYSAAIGEGLDSIDIYKDGVYDSTVSVVDSDDSHEKVYYFFNSNAGGTITKIILKDGVTELKTVNVIYAESCSNLNGSGVLKILPVLTYYDRNGMSQRTYLQGRIKTSLNTDRENYTKDLFATSLDFSYDTKLHQKQTYNVRCNEKVTVNSGWIPESQNEVYKQILLSEYVWLDDKPVYITSNNLEYKEQKYDKLINYTLEFEYANSEINNI